MDLELPERGRSIERVFPPWPAPGPEEGWTTGLDGEFAPLPSSGHGLTWRELPPRWIEAAAQDLPLDDDGALHFYLPALLDHIARGRDSGRAGDALAVALSPELGASVALRGLTLLQLREVVAFLAGRESRARTSEEREAAAGSIAHWRGVERACARRVRILWIASVVLIPTSIAPAVLGGRLLPGVGWIGQHLLLGAGIALGIASYMRRNGSRPTLLREAPDGWMSAAFILSGFILVVSVGSHLLDPRSFGFGWLAVAVAVAALFAWLGIWRRGMLRRRRERVESANGG